MTDINTTSVAKAADHRNPEGNIYTLGCAVECPFDYVCVCGTLVKAKWNKFSSVVGQKASAASVTGKSKYKLFNNTLNSIFFCFLASSLLLFSLFLFL